MLSAFVLQVVSMHYAILNSIQAKQMANKWKPRVHVIESAVLLVPTRVDINTYVKVMIGCSNPDVYGIAQQSSEDLNMYLIHNYTSHDNYIPYDSA